MLIINIISTPIGNMLDITLRALILLKTSTILCEHTDKTKRLLSHYKIKNKPNKLNEFGCYNAVRLKRDVCLVSDAGSPLISDPGYKAINVLSNRNYIIRVIPGACAVISALLSAKMPTNKFVFAGFLPSSNHKTKTQLIKWITTGLTIVAFESPKRVNNTIKSLITIAGRSLRLAVCIELTKLNESIIRGRAVNVYKHLRKLVPIGEITLVARSKTEWCSTDAADSNKITKLLQLFGARS
ncbi:Ribosomal RNA small subunit methyltransferase I [Candidatus Hodgkinia cicadicola]|nr:Ribosomal RNA small subunit methyltransferase I [Candidatus Hodgkinia cicadicola]